MEYAKTFNEGLEIYLKDNKGKTYASKQSHKDIQKLSSYQ